MLFGREGTARPFIRQHGPLIALRKEIRLARTRAGTGGFYRVPNYLTPGTPGVWGCRRYRSFNYLV